MDEQNHPLHAIDRETVDRLLAVERPLDEHLVDVARLRMRYLGFPGADDIRDDLERLLRLWDLDPERLHERTRAIWAAGFRPGRHGVPEAVGSGFDTASDEGT
ncbi:MAG: hypothetical protein ER33_01205 [Cyanobium sp. CACIAM 14]|nr:MAG: hypothetical protein ER33_01205 [Cyanobium sp. CACIAM 14]